MAAAASTPDGSDGDAGDAGGSVLGDLSTPHLAHTRVAIADDAVPLLVRVLAGNSVTSTTILGCLNTADARRLRCLHPAVAGVVAGVPWRDMSTPVVDAVRWRAGLPGAVGVRLDRRALEWKLTRRTLAPVPVWAVLGGVTHLDLHECEHVSDDVLLRLPTSLRMLSIHGCTNLTAAASFAHLAALTSLDSSGTPVVNERVYHLPPWMQLLDASRAGGLPHGVSLGYLRQLRVLRADRSGLDTVTLASLPPSLEVLHAAHCTELTSVASFAHLTALRDLDVAHSLIGDGSLATVPPCLVFLNARECKKLTFAAALPHLPALRLLDVSGTYVGDALVASLPASLIELRVAGCSCVTAGARLDHLHALRVLHCIGTELAPAALAACRARGCTMPAARQLRYRHFSPVGALTLLADGRLASGDTGYGVWLWNVAAGGEESNALCNADFCALSALRGDHLAIGTGSWDGKGGSVQVWDVGGRERPTQRATINCRSVVWALAMLADGRPVAGCYDGAVRVLDVTASAVATTLTGHTGGVAALAVLPDGALASGSWDKTVRVWDVGTGACVATLTGHTRCVNSLVVLPDGRLASGARYDNTVRLWEVGARASVDVLTGEVAALAALPDGRLATGSDDGTIQLWDTRTVTRPAAAAAAASSCASRVVPVGVVGVLSSRVVSLLALPDGRLACGGGGGTLYLLEAPPPAAARYE